MLKRIRAKAGPLTGNLSLMFYRYHGFAGMVRGAGLTVGWGLRPGAGVAPDRSRMSLVLVTCAERPEVSGVSTTPYGSLTGRLLRNLVQVHRSLVIPSKWICDIPEAESS